MEVIMTDANLTKTDKKIYSKPQVTVVHLVAEEAVLANCKDITGNQGACPDDAGCFPDSGATS
jgi:hypothetical protein